GGEMHKQNLEKSVRRFRETFHGKIAVEKATLLMRRYANNHQMVTWAVILKKGNGKEMVYSKCKPQSYHHRKPYGGVSKTPGPVLKSSRQPEDDNDIKELGERLRVLPLTEKNKRMFDNAQLHQLTGASTDCHLSEVSHCHLCKKKYDPVPYDKMWGIGEFCCTKCTQILPPRKGGVGVGGPRKPIPHSCLAEDCYNRQEPHVPGTECVHPRSRQRNRKPRVVNPSSIHISSGSTVNTCLSQGSLENLYDLIMDDIREESEEDNSSGSSSS
uniref:Shiftless antiviral inhibitor of ribosomal frameshifting n=1 Tax=Salmo trutta TaxID=8032 RepID=A0A674A3A6_SALTR